MGKLLIAGIVLFIIFVFAFMFYKNFYLDSGKIDSNNKGIFNGTDYVYENESAENIESYGIAGNVVSSVGGANSKDNGEGGASDFDVESGGRGAFLVDEDPQNMDGVMYCSDIDLNSCDESSRPVCGWYDPKE